MEGMGEESANITKGINRIIKTAEKTGGKM